MKDNIASEVITTKSGSSTQQISLEPGTVLLANHMVSWLDLMYGTLPLKTGESYTIPVFYPETPETRELTINVRPKVMEVQVNDKNYSVFVCDVPELNEVHYVTKENRHLVMIDRPDQHVLIRLVSNQ